MGRNFLEKFFDVETMEGGHKALAGLFVLLVVIVTIMSIIHMKFFHSNILLTCQTLEGLAFILSAFLIVKTQKSSWAFHIAILSGYVAILAQNVLIGRGENIYLLWTILCIIGAGLFTNRQGFIFWTVLTLLHPLLVNLMIRWLPEGVFVAIGPQEIHFLRGVTHTLLIIIIVSSLLTFTILAHQRNKRINEAKAIMSELVRILTYDIATPAHTIQKLSSELCIDYTEQKHFLGKMRDASGAIESIIKRIQDLKDFSDLSKMPECSATNLSDIIQRSADLYALQLQKKSIGLKINKRSNHTLVWAEKDVLTYQVLPNLIGNAIKFSSPHSEIELILDENKLLIKDQGIGIPMSILPHLFSYNQNTSRTGTSGEKGTGFGMPLVKTLLEKMGASIEIESQDIKDSPDKHGTTITLTFQKSDRSSPYTSEPSPEQ